MQTDIHAKERMVERQTTFDQQSKDPIERLKGRIEAICLDNDIYDYKTIDYFLEKIDEFDYNKAMYLNPVALIFGYYVIKKGTIDKELLKLKANNMFERILEENGVTRIDIVRYARFWLNLDKKEEKIDTPSDDEEEPKMFYAVEETDENIINEDDYDEENPFYNNEDAFEL